jgi:spermidine synthase
VIWELDYQRTPMGELILRSRRSPRVPEGLVYEVKLGDEMLMSSSVNESERALARLALERRGGEPCDVLVGGLGLGYTAAQVLEYPQVRCLDVIEVLAPVINWHRKLLVPAAARLVGDSRCTLIEDDFFNRVASAATEQSRRYDVILVDIDHSPYCWLHPEHGKFYTEERMTRLTTHLRPGGCFGLWSADEPSAEFLALLGRVFAGVESHEVQFVNPHISQRDSNWIVLAQI